MSNGNSKLDLEIDAGKFFLTVFYVIFSIGAIIFACWFYKNVYKPDERSYINASRYGYQVFYDEFFKNENIKKYIKDDGTFLDTEFCQDISRKYSKTKSGACTNFNPAIATENFVFKKKKNISVLGLEKPAFDFGGSLVKEIIIDKNTEQEGDNQVGSDRTILRIYISGRISGVITPVNCNKTDELHYNMKTSFYCIGSTGENFLNVLKPLSFAVEQTNTDTGAVRIIGNNVTFLRADCTTMDGSITDPGEYCSDKMLYLLKSCDDMYTCRIILSRN